MEVEENARESEVAIAQLLGFEPRQGKITQTIERKLPFDLTLALSVLETLALTLTRIQTPTRTLPLRSGAQYTLCSQGCGRSASNCRAHCNHQ